MAQKTFADYEQELLGRAGNARIVKIFAAVRNSDDQEGRGHDVDHSYHSTEAGARLGAVRIDVMGSDGKVEPRLALQFDDGRLLLIARESPVVELVDENSLKDKVKRDALNKLSPAERMALGLPTK